MKKLSIKNRCYECKETDDFSTLNYRITASRKIIQEMRETLSKIEDKYKKEWEDERP